MIGYVVGALAKMNGLLIQFQTLSVWLFSLASTWKNLYLDHSKRQPLFEQDDGFYFYPFQCVNGKEL